MIKDHMQQAPVESHSQQHRWKNSARTDPEAEGAVRDPSKQEGRG